MAEQVSPKGIQAHTTRAPQTNKWLAVRCTAVLQYSVLDRELVRYGTHIIGSVRHIQCNMLQNAESKQQIRMRWSIVEALHCTALRTVGGCTACAAAAYSDCRKIGMRSHRRSCVSKPR